MSIVNLTMSVGVHRPAATAGDHYCQHVGPEKFPHPSVPNDFADRTEQQYRGCMVPRQLCQEYQGINHPSNTPHQNPAIVA
jgi:hypothetical protein